ncbi:monooxygenase family protein [Paenibacillus shunpengii]|uniref:Monooxygenase family protein n=1 Tax=Paenibacillus shunpengii TaxID=2054424 RepID=A0ABW5SLN4_9BACL
MSKVIHGRYTAEMEGPFVVFIIGMRINRLLAFHKWVAVAKAMGPMIKELYENPQIGFMSIEFFWNWRGITYS